MIPVGAHLARMLAARGWTQKTFAEVLDRPTQFVSEIVTGKKGITRESAAQIGAALDTGPELWLGLQDGYHLQAQRSDERLQRSLVEIRLRAAARSGEQQEEEHDDD